MSTSGTKQGGVTGTRARRRLRARAVSFLSGTLFCIVFDRIYALFSHGVSSAAMNYMFLFPLLLGPICLLVFKGRREHGFYLCSLGIPTLVLGNLLTGVLEIAGAASPYLVIYYIVGGSLFSLGLLLSLITFLWAHSPWRRL